MGRHLEAEEDPKSGCIRETQEEASISLDPSSVYLVDVWRQVQQHESRIVIGYTALVDDMITVSPHDKDEIKELMWVSLADIGNGSIDVGTYRRFILEKCVQLFT